MAELTQIRWGQIKEIDFIIADKAVTVNDVIVKNKVRESSHRMLI